MALDIQTRSLPKNWFVNRAGRICQFNDKEKRFYCGATVVLSGDTKYTSNLKNGVCGPNEGDNCNECSLMDYQYDKRYAIINEV